jgi:hypothetical protein
VSAFLNRSAVIAATDLSDAPATSAVPLEGRPYRRPGGRLQRASACQVASPSRYPASNNHGHSEKSSGSTTTVSTPPLPRRLGMFSG